MISLIGIVENIVLRALGFTGAWLNAGRGEVIIWTREQLNAEIDKIAAQSPDMSEIRQQSLGLRLVDSWTQLFALIRESAVTLDQCHVPFVFQPKPWIYSPVGVIHDKRDGTGASDSKEIRCLAEGFEAVSLDVEVAKKYSLEQAFLLLQQMSHSGLVFEHADFNQRVNSFSLERRVIEIERRLGFRF
jgi:hypothetical protein